MNSYLALEHALLQLCAMLAIMVAISRLFGWLVGKIGQPSVVGEILGGVVLGPSVLGHFYPHALSALLTPQINGNLFAISQIGLILLMLLIGLEFPFDKLRHAAKPALAVAAAGIVVPFAGAYALAIWLYPIAFPPGTVDPGAVNASPQAFKLFFATAVSITAIPIMGRILMYTRLTQSRMGLTAITAAAFDDVLGWIILGAVVAVVVHGEVDFAHLALSLLGVAVLSAAFWALGRFVVARLPVPCNPVGGLQPTALAVVLIVTFLCATATNYLGVFSIFGGLLCGIAGSFNRTLAEGLKTSINDLVYVFFMPIFFVLSGLRTDIGSLGSAAWGWIALAAVIAVSCATKFGATFVAARATGLTWRESWGVGMLMNTRALMALVVINIGYDLGVISASAFFWLVTMALFTTVVTTPILRKLFPDPTLAPLPEHR